MYCKNCGTRNRDDAKFCRKCGFQFELGESSRPSYEDAASRKHSSRKKMIIAFSILIIIALTVVATVFVMPLLGQDNLVHGGDSVGTRVSDQLFYSLPDESHVATDADAGVSYVNNELIVYLTDGLTRQDAEALAKEHGAEIVGMSAYTGSYQIRFDKNYTYDEMLALSETIEADARVYTTSRNIATTLDFDSRTSDPVWSGSSKQYWGLTTIKAPEAWDIVQADSSIHVGIIDSQFYSEHEDLQGAFAEQMPSYETSFNAKGNGEDGKHGTHVAGIIGARTNGIGVVGVAPGVSLYGYSAIGNMVNKSGKEKITLSYGLEIGWTYLVVQNGCRVINMSLGSDEQRLKNSINSEDVIPQERKQLIEESRSYENSLRALIRAGYDDFVICKSTGNNGDKGALADYDFLGFISAEDVKSRIIMVGSVSGSDGRPSISKFSCDGRRVDILAPGEDIYSTYYDYNTPLFGKETVEGTYSYLSGTSMATPMVSGVAALVIAANPSLKGDQIKQIICESAEQNGYAVANLYFVGLLDAEAAVKKALSAQESEPADDAGASENGTLIIDDQNEHTVEETTGEDSAAATAEGYTRYTLSGVVRVHEENVRDSMVTVVSMTLDEPVDYEDSYRGVPSSGTAREVEISSSVSDDFSTWAAYNGRHITVECESLHWAYHDGGLHNVDSFAGGVRLISADPLAEDSSSQSELPDQQVKTPTHEQDSSQQDQHDVVVDAQSAEDATFNGNRYRYIESGKVTTWDEARAYCEQLGGHLATITSQEENDFLFSYLQSHDVVNAYFGFTNLDSEGVWSWVTGEDSEYTNWHEGEPNSTSGGEYYGMFYWKFEDGTWNDGNFCNGTERDDSAFICEWEG